VSRRYRHPRPCYSGLRSACEHTHTHQRGSNRISYFTSYRKRIVIDFSPPFGIRNQRIQRSYYIPPRSDPPCMGERARRSRCRKNCHGGRRPRYRTKMHRRTPYLHPWQVRGSHGISNHPKARESSWHITPWPSGQSPHVQSLQYGCTLTAQPGVYPHATVIPITIALSSPPRFSSGQRRRGQGGVGASGAFPLGTKVDSAVRIRARRLGSSVGSDWERTSEFEHDAEAINRPDSSRLLPVRFLPVRC
jgi:hypothetical protein